MFDIAFSEFFLFAVIALIILGPSRLPQAIRTMSLWLGRIRRTYNNIRLEIDQEVGIDEVRKQLHNEQILAEMKDLQQEARQFHNEIRDVSQATLSRDENVYTERPPAQDEPTKSDG